MSTAIATRYSSTDWSLFHKLCNIKRQNLPYWNCNTDFVTRLVGEAYSTSTNPNIFLVRLCCSQHETDEEVIPSRQTNSLVINQRVWFVLFVVNQFHRHIWLLGLSCLLATNFTVIFGCLVCLVCYQPISPSYLVVLITSKRGKHISAGTLATVLASYVVLISWK